MTLHCTKSDSIGDTDLSVKSAGTEQAVRVVKIQCLHLARPDTLVGFIFQINKRGQSLLR